MSGDVTQAIRTALRVREEERAELRLALESGDLEAVVRWARRELGIEEDEHEDAASNRARAGELRGAGRT